MTKQTQTENVVTVPTKVLINADYEALRVGEFVEANNGNGEFILANDSDLAVNTLYEISRANKLGVKKGRANEKRAMLEAILVEIGKLGLTEQNKMTDSQTAAKIVAEGIAENLEDEQIMLNLVQVGKFSIAKVNKIFQQAMQDGGFRITTKERREQIHTLLDEEEFKPATYADVESMLERLVAEVKDTQHSQAHAIMRGWAKKAEVELPKPAKRTGGSLRMKVLGWILENRPTSKQELHQGIFDLSNGKKDDPKLTENMWLFVQFAENFADKYGNTKDAEAESAAA